MTERERFEAQRNEQLKTYSRPDVRAAFLAGCELGWQAHAESVATRPEIVTPHPTHQMGPDFCFVCNEGRNKYPEITLSCKGLDIESKAESAGPLTDTKEEILTLRK